MFSESVAVAFEADDVCLVHDPVDPCRGDGQVAEDVAPAGEGGWTPESRRPRPGTGSSSTPQPAGADRKVGFTSAGGSEQDHVLGFREEHTGAQMRDEVPVRGGLVIEVGLLQVLVRGEPCGLDPGGRSGGFAFGDFPGENGCRVFRVGPAGVAGLLPEAAETIAAPRCSPAVC